MRRLRDIHDGPWFSCWLHPSCMRFFPSTVERDRHAVEDHGMRTIAPEGEPRIFPCGIGDCQFIGQTPQGLGAHRRHTHPKGEIKIQRDDGLTLTPDEADWLELYLNTWELPSVALADMTDDDLMAIGLLRRLRAR